MKLRILITACSAIICLSQWALSAQSKNTYSVKDWWDSKPHVFSPVVHEDSTITFRYRSPTAIQVELHFGEWFVKPQQMQKDSHGVWSITIGPLEPQIYAYNFKVDDTWIIDPHNVDVKVGTQVYSSMVEVPGHPPRFDQVQDVTHGSLHIHQYLSSSLNKLRSVHIYLPPGYHENANRSYPVLYLRHGGGDDERSWSSTSGRAGVIAENLVATKKAVPMIIVMPNCMTDGTWAGGSSLKGMQDLETELLNDIIPLVEKLYRVKPGKINRAMAGLSMGGGQSVIIGLRNMDKFAWLGNFSSGLLSAVEFDIETYVPSILSQVDKVNEEIKLLWLACGTDDGRHLGHMEFVEKLRTTGFNTIKYHEMPGGHEWTVWRTELYEFLQHIFTDASEVL